MVDPGVIESGSHRYPWRVVFLLAACSVAVHPLSYPFIAALENALTGVPLPPLTWRVLLSGMAFVALMDLTAAAGGLYAAKRIGLAVPLLQAKVYGERTNASLRSILVPAISIAVGLTLLVIGIEEFLFHRALGVLEPAYEIHSRLSGVPAWAGVLASFEGGIGEEIVFRLFLLSGLGWLITTIVRRRDGVLTPAAFWTANAISTLVFGLYHLTGAEAPIIMLRTLVDILPFGMAFGYLYRKHGLEAAMVSHFTVDILVHGIRPLFG